MSTIKLVSTCPNCNSEIQLSADMEAKDLAPKVHARIKPVSSILEYHISSDEMRVFITEKAKKYCPDVKVDVVPRYVEKKRRSKSEPHRSYASLRIAFSEHVLEKKEDLGWYGKIGESSDSLRIIPSMFTNLFQMYRYDPNQVKSWLKSYTKMAEIQDALGITEDYLMELNEFVKPRRVFTDNKEPWIIFAAAAENVIVDMLTDSDTQELIGRIEIVDIHPISKENVEFIVYVHPEEVKYAENPHIRQILTGEKKK